MKGSIKMRNIYSYNAGSNISSAVIGAQVDSNPVGTFENNKTNENEIKENGNKSLITWGILAILYFIWAWFDEQDTLKESIQPSNLKANFRTLALTTLSVIVFGNLAKILVGKMAESKIPVINKIATSVLPLL